VLLAPSAARSFDLPQYPNPKIRYPVSSAEPARVEALGAHFQDLNMNRNILYLTIGILAVATVVFGYRLYQERQKTTGIEINVGKSGISIEKR
jgi:hypothetical protein